MVTAFSSTPLIIGETSMTTAWMLPFRPLILVNSFSGTSCGRMALTAGIWMPDPSARMADAASNTRWNAVPPKIGQSARA